MLIAPGPDQSETSALPWTPSSKQGDFALPPAPPIDPGAFEPSGHLTNPHADWMRVEIEGPSTVSLIDGSLPSKGGSSPCSRGRCAWVRSRA